MALKEPPLARPTPNAGGGRAPAQYHFTTVHRNGLPTSCKSHDAHDANPRAKWDGHSRECAATGTPWRERPTYPVDRGAPVPGPRPHKGAHVPGPRLPVGSAVGPPDGHSAAGTVTTRKPPPTRPPPPPRTPERPRHGDAGPSTSRGPCNHLSQIIKVDVCHKPFQVGTANCLPTPTPAAGPSRGARPKRKTSNTKNHSTSIGPPPRTCAAPTG